MKTPPIATGVMAGCVGVRSNYGVMFAGVFLATVHSDYAKELFGCEFEHDGPVTIVQGFVPNDGYRWLWGEKGEKIYLVRIDNDPIVAEAPTAPWAIFDRIVDCSEIIGRWE
ncbi:hypothetical protein EON82_25025 [bacterium]|nr:MAG: hypothetical protein EON82_25025 [bacterium]